MVPMVQSGCGLNFGLPLGIIAGLLGAVTSVELEARGIPGVFAAMAIATPIAVILGWGYGLLLNKVKGEEMMIATYVGFSSVAFMCIMWLVLPYSSSNMVWGSRAWACAPPSRWKSSGSAPSATSPPSTSANPSTSPPACSVLPAAVRPHVDLHAHPHRHGLDHRGLQPRLRPRKRREHQPHAHPSVILSTWLGALGIIVYEQSFGFIQLYMGPFMMASPAWPPCSSEALP